MRRPTLLAALVLAIVLLAAVPVVAAQRATLEASLTGEKEVPGPGDPNGRGEADVKVYKAKVCYKLEVRRIAPAAAAHIHLGLRLGGRPHSCGAQAAYGWLLSGLRGCSLEPEPGAKGAPRTVLR